MDVPSPVAGIMSEHRVAVGDTVEVGAVIAVIEAGATAATAPAAAKWDTSSGQQRLQLSNKQNQCPKV